MKLDELIRSLPEVSIYPSQIPDIKINDLTTDSRLVTPGSLFVAIPGFKTDGHRYLAEVVSKGVRAVVVEKKEGLPESVVQIVVPESRSALAFISCEFYRHPSKELVLVGVTGTNGKTTTTYLLESIFREAGFEPGVMGTVNYRFAGTTLAAPHTTPEAYEFQSMLRQMRSRGVTHVVCEVSSHALSLHRVDGSHFNAALFTNLSQDHLDFHEDFENYFLAKKRFFTEVLPNSGKHGAAAVMNIDDAYGKRLMNEFMPDGDKRLVTFSLQDPKADVFSESFRFSLRGLHAKIRAKKESISIQSKLLGKFNLMNILGAISAAFSLDIPKEAIIRGIAKLEQVPGRLDRVEGGDDFLVLVDYAHTDDALKNVLGALKAIKKNRIITVFGCGGDRDRKKRPLMAKAAAQFSDVIIVTSDNPRTEDPNTIIDEILAGLVEISAPLYVPEKKKGYLVEPDRKSAIEKAIRLAQIGDIVLIAGKGHEDYQILGTTKIHFDDKEIAREALCSLKKKS